MKNKIFIGVDGGGTKCKLRMEDAQGNLLGQGLGGPANIRLSVENSWQSINQALAQALQEAKISLTDADYEFYAGMALAGCEVPLACEAFLKQPHPFKKIILKSDAYAACLGAHGGKEGAIIIIGTGVVGMQIEGNHVVQVGGWGFPHGDEGGGAWLGLEALRLTLRWLHKLEQESPMLVAIFQHFNNDQGQIATWANAANSTAFASMTPFVVEYARQEDPHAIKLLQQAGRYIDEIAVALDKQAINKNLAYSLFGGVAPFVEPWLCEDLHARLRPRQFDATVGAIYMVRSQE